MQIYKCKIIMNGDKIMNFEILVEESFADNNFCAYVPAFRISALGDTYEEALKNAEDLIRIRLAEMGEKVKVFASKTVNLKVVV